MDNLNINFSGWEEEKTTTRQRLGYSAFVVPLVKAVQELSAEVNNLKQQLKEQS